MAKSLNTALQNKDSQLMIKENLKWALPAPPEPLAIQAPSTSAIQITPPPKNKEPVISWEPNWGDVPDFDLMSFLSELDEDNFSETAMVPYNPNNASTNTNTTVQKAQGLGLIPPSTGFNAVKNTNQMIQNRSSPMFTSCKIGNITINPTKK